MPTDHACQAAAKSAAHGITPVRAVLAPVRPVARRRQDTIPVVMRQYYGIVEDDPVEEAPEPEPVSSARGGVVLLTFLDGLRATLNGALLDWYVELPVQVPHAVGAPAPGAEQVPPPGEPNPWQVLTELNDSGQELLTLIVDRRREDRVGELNRRLALVEDVFVGALRRLDVPVDTSLRSAAQVADAAASLFGIRR